MKNLIVYVFFSFSTPKPVKKGTPKPVAPSESPVVKKIAPFMLSEEEIGPKTHGVKDIHQSQEEERFNEGKPNEVSQTVSISYFWLIGIFSFRSMIVVILKIVLVLKTYIFKDGQDLKCFNKRCFNKKQIIQYYEKMIVD